MQIFEPIQKWWSGIMNMASAALNTPLVGNGGVAYDTTPEALRPVLAILDAELKRQRLVVKARKMHDGEHGTILPDRLRRLLGDEAADIFCHRANYLARVNRGISKREVIEGFKSSAIDTAEQRRQIQFADAVWAGSRMKAKRAELMLMKNRDGEAFILIDSDVENDRPRWTPHQTYTDATVGGDGEGVQLYYPNNDTNQKPLFGVKRWTEHIRKAGGGTRLQNRITVWFDNRIERYAQGDISGKGGWQLLPLALPDGGELPEVEWNTVDRTESGTPLGIPIVHLKTPDLKPSAREAIPVQLALNKTYTDMLAASDMESMRLLVALGWIPTHDGTAKGVPMTIEPGTWIWSKGGDGEEPKQVHEIQPSDSTRFIQLIDQNIRMMADVTETPLSELRGSGQHKAEGAQQESKEDYYAKIRDYQETVEIAFEDALKISRRHHNAFHVTAEMPILDETPDFGVSWQPLSTRTTADKVIEAEGMIASSFPLETVWADAWDKTPEEVAAMMAAKKKADRDAFYGPTDEAPPVDGGL